MLNIQAAHLIQSYFNESETPLDRWYAELSREKGKTLPSWDVVRNTLRQGHWHQFLVENSGENLKNKPWEVLERWFGRSQDQVWDPRVLGKSPPGIPLDVLTSPPNETLAWGLKFIQSGFPPFLFPSWLKAVKLRNQTPGQIAEFFSVLNKKPGLFLRVYQEKHRETVLADLKGNEFQVRQISESTWEAEGKKSIFSCPSWKAGLFQIQDWASQQVGEWVSARPGDRVLDLCAGKGGKTLIMAQDMRGKGSLWALDIRESKLRTLKTRVKSQDFPNVRIKSWDGLELPAFPQERALGGFTKILVDAPCSASGTWHRDPEGAFKINQATLKTLQALQKDLLNAASTVLAPRGEIIYSTCSWIPEEDELQIIPEGMEVKTAVYFGPPMKNSSWLFASRLFKKSSSV